MALNWWNVSDPSLDTSTSSSSFIFAHTPNSSQHHYHTLDLQTPRSQHVEHAERYRRTIEGCHRLARCVGDPSTNSKFASDPFRTLRVPFLSAEHASIAKRALEVDREQNADFVERTIETEGTELIV